mmetsp:Transcript_29640/g.60524  ORF Transcript_29640/g.60524 Transcript_29640/m.60524 type:complete len:539 (-) Transcript_29640:89-1705(-)
MNIFKPSCQIKSGQVGEINLAPRSWTGRADDSPSSSVVSFKGHTGRNDSGREAAISALLDRFTGDGLARVINMRRAFAHSKQERGHVSLTHCKGEDSERVTAKAESMRLPASFCSSSVYLNSEAISKNAAMSDKTSVPLKLAQFSTREAKLNSQCENNCLKSCLRTPQSNRCNASVQTKSKHVRFASTPVSLGTDMNDCGRTLLYGDMADDFTNTSDLDLDLDLDLDDLVIETSGTVENSERGGSGDRHMKLMHDVVNIDEHTNEPLKENTVEEWDETSNRDSVKREQDDSELSLDDLMVEPSGKRSMAEWGESGNRELMKCVRDNSELSLVDLFDDPDKNIIEGWGNAGHRELMVDVQGVLVMPLKTTLSKGSHTDLPEPALNKDQNTKEFRGSQESDEAVVSPGPLMASVENDSAEDDVLERTSPVEIKQLKINDIAKGKGNNLRESMTLQDLIGLPGNGPIQGSSSSLFESFRSSSSTLIVGFPSSSSTLLDSNSLPSLRDQSPHLGDKQEKCHSYYSAVGYNFENKVSPQQGCR